MSVAVAVLQMPPPVTQHPGVELGDLRGRAGLHEEAADAGRGPVVEVVETETMADLVQQDVDVVGVERADEVLAADPLPPVTAGAAVHPRGEPQRHVVMM